MAHVHSVTDNNNQTRKKIRMTVIIRYYLKCESAETIGHSRSSRGLGGTAMPPRARLLGDKPSYLVCGGD